MRWKCPDCGESCRIRSSKQPVKDLRFAFLQCNDIQCGWRGKGTFEIVESYSAKKIA
ncbi:ogr/Delta-like zinc finger family protein [Zymobacter sp. IVIA_12111.31 C1]|uniref:ogr/Delta-like zinc finger family protein n=1 Tax=Zymobacter sp. IVIA_12111.31 C1 TaxID=3394854 RepID=UPI0039C3B23E